MFYMNFERFDELLKSLYSSDDPNEAFQLLITEYERLGQQFFEIMASIFNSNEKEKVIRKEVLFVIKNIISNYDIDMNQLFDISLNFISPDIEFHDLIVKLFFEFCMKKNALKPDEQIFIFEFSDEAILQGLVILESYSSFILSSKIQKQFSFFLQYSNDYFLHILEMFSNNPDNLDYIYIIIKIIYNIVNINFYYPLLEIEILQIYLNFTKNYIILFNLFIDKPYIDDILYIEMNIIGRMLYYEQIRENEEIYQFIFDFIFSNELFQQKQIYCSSFFILQTILDKTTIFKENVQLFIDYFNGIFVPFLISYISSIDCFNDENQVISDEFSFFGSSLLYEDAINSIDSCWKSPLDSAKIICTNFSRFSGSPENLLEFFISCIQSIELDTNTITSSNLSSQINEKEKAVIIYFWVLGLSGFLKENDFLKSEFCLLSDSPARIIGSLICIYHIACENNLTNALNTDAFFDIELIQVIFQLMEQDDDQIIKIVAERTFHHVIGQCSQSIIDQLDYDPTSILQSFFQDNTDFSIIHSIKTIFEVFPLRVLEISKEELLENCISSLATCISSHYFEQVSLLRSLIIEILKYIVDDEFFIQFCCETIAFIQNQFEQAIEDSNQNDLLSTWFDLTDYIFNFNYEDILNAAIPFSHSIYELALDPNCTFISIQEFETSLRNLIFSSSERINDLNDILTSIIQYIQEIIQINAEERDLYAFETFSELLASFYLSNFQYTQSILNIIEILIHLTENNLLDHCFYLITSMIYNNINNQENLLDLFDSEHRRAIIDAWIRYDNGFIPFTISFMKCFQNFNQEEKTEIIEFINQDIENETNFEEEEEFCSEINCDWPCFNLSYEETVQQFRQFLSKSSLQKQEEENLA